MTIHPNLKLLFDLMHYRCAMFCTFWSGRARLLQHRRAGSGRCYLFSWLKVLSHSAESSVVCCLRFLVFLILTTEKQTTI